MPALGQGSGKSAAGEKAAKRKPKTYSLPNRSSRGDSPSTRASDFKRANTYKRTPSYQKALYKSAPVKKRQARIKAILAKPGTKLTASDKAVLETHRGRAKRDSLLLRSKPNARQQTLIAARKATPSYAEALAASKRSRQAHEAKNVDFIHETDPRKLEAAGFHKDGVLEGIVGAPKYALGALASGGAVAEATYHDPIGVPSKTAKQFLHAIPAIPGGVYDLVTHPAKTIKLQAKQFAKRSGQTIDERVKTIRKEGGLEYGGDAATVIGGSSAATRLGLTLRGLKHVPSPRAAVRLSGGTVRTPKARGALGDAVGRAAQQRRGVAHEKALQVAEAGGKPVDPLVYQAAKANREAGRVVETVARGAGRKQRRLVAKQRGRAIYGLKTDQHRRIAADTKAIHTLSKKERKALYYADVFGIRNPEHAAAVLPKLETMIRDTRAREGVQVTGSLKKSDMLPDITAMSKAPHEYFTPKLADTVEKLRPDSLRAAAEDPSLHPFVERRRRYAPLAAVLGVERGVKHEMPPLPKLNERRSANGRGVVVKPTDPAGQKLWNEYMQLTNKDTRLSNAEWDRIAELKDRFTQPYSGPERRVTERVPGQSLAEAVAHINGRVPELRYFDESDAEHVDRVAQKAKDLGLAEPLYFKSERYADTPTHGSFTVGGLRAAKRGPAYKGENLAAGLQDTSPKVYLAGKAQNIKRKHNWNLVADTLQSNAIADLAPHHPGGTTVSALRENMAKSGVDMNEVALWNPGVYRQLAHDATSGSEHFDQPENFDNANVSAALAHSVIRIHDGHVTDGTGLPVSMDKLAESSGWHAVPDATLKELEAQMVPSGKAGRMWDIAKGKASRALLLTGNVPWLGFQVASNAAVSAVATGGRILNPKNWLDAHTWWKHDLTEEQRQRVGAQLGLDATGADSHQIRLGATTNNDLVNTYRAIKAHPIFHTGIANGRGPSLSELNPLELMARADRTQNNIFRIAAGYSKAKRDAVRSMGEAMGRADRAQLAITSIMSKPPAEQLRAIADNRQLMEDHADAINDWMGDYTTMTASERKVINRAAMFYPYLRYSLRLMFYTLPIKHPAVTAALAELGQLRSDELEKLFGKNGLPFNLGKIYFGSGGKVKSIDLKRANPMLNSLIDAASNKNPAQLVGVAPPWAGWLFDQLAQKSSFTGKDWKVNGRAAPYGGPHLPVLDKTRASILADDILGLTFPYREAEKLTQRGTQGDDSTLWDERRTHYAGTDPLSQLTRKFGDRRTNFAQDHESIIHDLIPLLPQADRGPAEARETKILAKATPKPGAKKRKAKTKYFGGGSSGSHYFGASK